MSGAGGTTVRIEPPRYMGISAPPVSLSTRADQEQVLTAADDAIAFLHPLHGGYDGTGWPFGRDVSVGDIYSCSSRFRG